MGNIIKQFRETRGWTQEQLGKLVGVKKAAVSKWEADDNVVPSPAVAIRLEEVSGGVLARWMTRPDLWEAPPFRPKRARDASVETAEIECDESAPCTVGPEAPAQEAAPAEEVTGSAP